ncbi:MAG: type II CAAX endopeptidase family protein [Candidatus Eisenbacteria bacterium]
MRHPSYWFNGPAGDSPGSPPPPRDRDPYEPRGPLPPDPPPENPTPTRSEVGHPLFRVCFYLGTIFVLLNLVGLLAIGVYFAVTHPGEGLDGIAALAENLGTPELLLVYAVSAPVALAWTLFFRRVLQKRTFASLGFRRRRWMSRSAVGWLAGIVLSGLVFVAGIVTGVYEPHLPTEPVRWGLIGALCLGFLVQGATEEVIVRGYAQKNMVEWKGKARSFGWVLVFPSLVFSLAHVSNPETGPVPAANTFLIGLALGALVLAQGDLWAAIGFHAGWNFGLAGIWSLPVSGIKPAGWLVVEMNEELPDWARLAFGGAYGPEGGLVVTVLVVLAISILLPAAMDRWPRDRWGAGE